MQLIETIEVGSGGASSITFSNISQDFTDLVLQISARADSAFGSPDDMANDLLFKFNGDTAANYDSRRLQGNGSSAGSSSFQDQNELNRAYTNGVDATANTFGSTKVYIANYTSSTAKSISIDSVQESNESTSYMNLLAGLWDNTNALNSIEIYTLISGNFVEGTVASLYGVLAEDNPDYPLSEPKATGGSISYSGGYWYHTFTSSDTFTPSESLSCDYLVIAGGGAGDSIPSGDTPSRASGGGGAGGLLAGSSSVTAQAYTITVGAGGAAGSSGSDSAFDSIATPTGGGRGGYMQNGANGGSGGGTNARRTAGTGISGQGNNGSNWQYSEDFRAGGGGGAGEAGFGTEAGGTDGGDGLQYSDYASASGINVDGGYFAGGGGAGYATGTPGNGGLGGGGNGGRAGSTASQAGDANTGGGGGGGSRNNTTFAQSGAGGSGLVIVRYLA